jgi:hypothetical protein
LEHAVRAAFTMSDFEAITTRERRKKQRQNERRHQE